MWGSRILAGLGVALVALGGCGGEAPPAAGPEGSGPATPAERPAASVARLDEHRTLGAPVTVGNLTVWPLHTDRPLDIGEFLTLSEAQAEGLAEVREVGRPPSDAATSSPGSGQMRSPFESGYPLPVPQEPAPPEPVQQEPVPQEPVPQEAVAPGPQPSAEDPEPAEEEPQQGVPQVAQRVAQQVLIEGVVGDGAVVNTLVIENRGDLPILVCAGTIVTGGKQDRQIGQDFVIAAHTTVPVDAFCVEQSRWSPSGRAGLGSFAFESLGQVAFKGARAGAQYERDQGKVWDEVRVLLEDAEVEAPTQALRAAVEGAEEDALARREALEKAVLDHFASLAAGEDAPVGFAYAVDGRPQTVRAFAHARLFERQFTAFVKAMSLEADLARDEAGGEAIEAKAEDVVALVEALRAAEQTVEETRAANRNGYRRTEAGFNGTCFVPGDEGEEFVVLTEDWTAR